MTAPHVVQPGHPVRLRPPTALIISTFPPLEGGIATCAREQMLALKRQGTIVYSQTFDPACAASFRYSNRDIKGLLQSLAAVLLRRFDSVYLHLSEGLFFAKSGHGLECAVIRWLQHLWLLLLAWRYGRRFTLIVHELETEQLAPGDLRARRFIFRRVRALWVGSARERHRLAQAFGVRVGTRAQVVDLEPRRRAGGDLGRGEARPRAPHPVTPVHDSGPPSDWAPRQRRFLAERRLLFIMPVFGATVRGGAEKFAFHLACALGSRGAQLEVWTTDSSSAVERNHDLSGADDSGLPFRIRRFPVNRRVEGLFQLAHRRLNRPGGCGPLLRYVWKRANVHGIGMEQALDREQHRFDVIHLFHYLLGSAHRLSGRYPQKMVLYPWIHDEPALYSPVMRRLFAGVAGVTCSSPASTGLAQRGPCGLVPELYHAIGNGAEAATVPFEPMDLEGFARPYVVFVGRMVEEKELSLLMAWHEELLQRDPTFPSLLCVGQGPLQCHPVFSRRGDRVRAVGYVREGQRRALVRDALALVLLSRLESFSLVVMEAWLEQVPVIVHRDCPATSDHVAASGGGFVVATREDYGAAVDALRSSSETRRCLGTAGEQYVQQRFTWDQVCSNYARAVMEILGEG